MKTGKINKASQVIFFIGILVAVGFAASWKDYPEDLISYRNWFSKERGFVSEKTIKDLKFSVQYKPVELMVINEIKNTKANMQTLVLDSLKNSYGSSRYFLLEIGLSDKHRPNSGDLIKNYSHNYTKYRESIQYLAFEMNESAKLVISGDTLEPAIYHFEQGFELTSSQKFLFAFQPTGTQRDQEEMLFIIDDEFFGGGRLKFRFNIDHTQIPKLPI